MAGTRTLKLSHEQIAIIQNALGIAEKIFTELHSDAARLTIVRNNEANRYKQQQAINSLHEQSIMFSDLNDSIANGEIDV